MTEHAETAPTVARAARVRAVVIAGLGSALAGVAVGGVWAWIAPPIHAVVALTRAGERVHDYLGDESEHFFDAPCLLLGLLTVLAVVVAVLAWQWRAHRGPGMVVALSTGMVTAAAAAAATGAALVRISYGALNFDAVPLAKGPSVAYVVQAPPVFFADNPLQVALTLLWPAAIAALVYAVLAAADARDDLGALPTGGGSSDAVPVGAGGASESPQS
ncbi:hypothetical protein HMPREF0591_0470 [Mycobacterium parascrofulaceum ATCC BAA-614]|uniref:Uncharacterized protein n=1 Tax=Mycobacterium parascrofulaceum ATCC BAA-614 TaxID=525368 RepID=D5P2S6_9MYCO|nr:hypothetical protein HMPREF0591_0470 [Mycobacterium parascrofulaceum ATCC BAA-614]OCB41693.1 hypothetical protein A9X02_15770 [Mycobacterium malmoense]